MKKKSWKPWTDPDREKLKQLAGRFPTEEIAVMMERSMSSVQKEAQSLRLSLRYQKRDRARKKWTQEEDMFLESLAGELPPRMIADRMGRPVEGIYRRAMYKGISLVMESDNWPAKRLAELLEIDPSTVISWIRKKWLTAYKVPHNRRYYISRENFRKFYTQHQATCFSLKKVNPEGLEFILND